MNTRDMVVEWDWLFFEWRSHAGSRLLAGRLWNAGCRAARAGQCGMCVCAVFTIVSGTAGTAAELRIDCTLDMRCALRTTNRVWVLPGAAGKCNMYFAIADSPVHGWCWHRTIWVYTACGHVGCIEHPHAVCGELCNLCDVSEMRAWSIGCGIR